MGNEAPAAPGFVSDAPARATFTPAQVSLAAPSRLPGRTAKSVNWVRGRMEARLSPALAAAARVFSVLRAAAAAAAASARGDESS